MFDYVYLIPLILGPLSMLMITVIILGIARGRQRRTEMKAEVQTKLIDKFGSSAEFIAFLKTEEGRRFLGEIESGPRLNARDRIIRGMGKSVIVGLVGVGFLTIGFIPATYNEFCIIVGFLTLALGVGLFLSAMLSLRLSRSWGLMEEEPTQPNV